MVAIASSVLAGMVVYQALHVQTYLLVPAGIEVDNSDSPCVPSQAFASEAIHEKDGRLSSRAAAFLRT